MTHVKQWPQNRSYLFFNKSLFAQNTNITVVNSKQVTLHYIYIHEWLVETYYCNYLLWIIKGKHTPCYKQQWAGWCFEWTRYDLYLLCSPYRALVQLFYVLYKFYFLKSLTIYFKEISLRHWIHMTKCQKMCKTSIFLTEF